MSDVNLGPTGEAVRANVERLRTQQKITYADLSRRLESAGRPIPPLGLRRIESGQRRVDADDLVALAFVLETSPATLLMPPVERTFSNVHVTAVGESEAKRVWEWLTARRYLKDVYILGRKAVDYDAIQRMEPTWKLTEQEESAATAEATDAMLRHIERLKEQQGEDSR